MKLRFNIHYATAWGETLHVVITYRTKSGRDRAYDIPMKTDDGQQWMVETAVMESRQHPVVSFSYFYQVESEDGDLLRREWTKVSRTYPFDGSKDYLMVDEWRDVPLQNHLYSLAYNRTDMRDGRNGLLPLRFLDMPLFRKTVFFRISAPQLQRGEALGICGGHPVLGDWNPMRYLRMEYLGDSEWALSVNVDHVQLPLEYKYVVVDSHTQEMKRWEEGENRRVEDGAWGLEHGRRGLADGQVLVLHGGILHLREAIWKAAGVVVPVFALRSEHSYGVGDFGDLRRMVDWAAATGMKMIQLLPLNDTTVTRGWNDSHPYNCISAFALHPHYLDLEQVGTLEHAQDMLVFNRQRRELNASADSDYLSVDCVKSDYINKIFAECGEATLAKVDFQAFYADHASWLVPYAAFCALRDKFGTARFSEWKQYAVYDAEVVAHLADEGSMLREAIRKCYFVQYHLHRQLNAVSSYARSKGIALKGDIPVGVYRDSVEAWVHPDFFQFDMQMGTMPSDTEPAGQNWGFPTWQWEHNVSLEKWWRARLRHLERYFDAVRIDHILSFFRTWAIPVGSLSPVMGHFVPALPLSEEEIAEMGLAFRRQSFTQPFINDALLERLFGMHVQYVREHFLEEKGYGLYKLKEAFDTQVKVQAHFHGLTDEDSLWIRDGLYRLCANVLFIEDSRQPGMFHPRFGIIGESAYAALGTDEKEAFSRIYYHYFNERHQSFWKQRARMKLAAVLRDTRLLVCAEDLGQLPEGVSQVLDEQQVLSLEIHTCPKQHGFEFGHLSAHPYRSVVTISTHDMPPLRLWWEEDGGRVQRYYATMLQKEGRAPRHLPAHLAEEIVARHLYSPSMLCLLSLQDWLSMDANLRSPDVERERINAPYDCYNQWKYRMHLTIEQLLEANQYNNKVKTMITRSQR